MTTMHLVAARIRQAMRRIRRTKPDDPLSARQSDVFEAALARVRRSEGPGLIRLI